MDAKHTLEVPTSQYLMGHRDKRYIAHGRRNDFTVSSAMECNRFLRELAVRIDNHIVTNFFVIEAYS